MAQAVILGSGTSNGVPSLGVEYSDEFLANPKNWRTRPSLLLRGPTGNVLVDATPDMRTQLLRERVMDLEAVIITHTHADHVMGMDDLRAYCLKTGRAMPIYALPDAQEDIRRIFPYAFADLPPQIEVPRYTFCDVTPNLDIGGITIQTMQVLHGKMPVIAMRIGDFAYVTDVSEIPTDAWDQLRGLDTLILDAVRRRPHPNHFHLDKAIEVAMELGAKQTFFTHLSHDYDHDVTERELPTSIYLAYDGLAFEL